MNLAVISLKRPIFISCLVILMLVGGLVAMFSLPVDLYPKVDTPYVIVSINYPGAGPQEIETVVTKPVEDELVSLEGVKKIKSTSQNSISLIEIEFKLGLNPDVMEQKVRDRVSLAQQKFPKAVKNPTIQKIDFSNASILTITVNSKSLDITKITDWIDRDLKAQISQVPKVGKIEILGGRKREIHVQLNPGDLERYKIPLVTVSDELSRSGENVPGGTIKSGNHEFNVKNIGEFSTLESIDNRMIVFRGGEAPVRVRDLGHAEEGASKETSRGFHNSEKVVMIEVYKQSGANVIEVTDLVKKRVEELAETLKQQNSDIEVKVVRDGAKEIRDNVWDVQESIMIGILLTIIVVYLFLGSFKSTLITGLALPNSLLGAFILVSVFGFSINIMTLLALSLAVGLLVDDAIVVRENIFKHLETGKSPLRAALDGTNEVRMAVIATTLAIISVFGAVGFMTGSTGQWFKEFGLTVCFAMLISLFDALTIAPMLSAYWGGGHADEKKSAFSKLLLPFEYVAKVFDRFQTSLEKIYHNTLKVLLAHPVKSTLLSIGFAFSLFYIASFLPSTFFPQAEAPELSIEIELPTGLTLDESQAVTFSLLKEFQKVEGVRDFVSSVGNANEEVNIAKIWAILKSPEDRELKSTQIRAKYREIIESKLKEFPEGTSVRVNLGSGGVSNNPYELAVLAYSHEEVKKYGGILYKQLEKEKLLKDMNSTSKPGKPEVVVKIDQQKAQRFGISEGLVGNEIRGRIEGIEAARFRENGREYDIRVRIKDGSKDFMKNIHSILVPNINLLPVQLSDFAQVVQSEGDNKLLRTNRSSSMKISANLPDGVGLGEVMTRTREIVKELKIPPTVKFIFEGEGESFDDMGNSMLMTFGFAILLIYLVLASLYESFFIPVLVMSALPLAIGGAFVSLLIAGQGFDMYSIIGMLLLMGVATKNSILLVDTVMEKIREEGSKEFSMIELISHSSVQRLRPILMTSLALIAGMVPIAIGLNEASAQRTSLGTAVIGGTISSTALTLILIPALLMLVRKKMMKTAVASSERVKRVDEIS
jgi:HAE1 family hydrophobic/amphiphilic exporter-1